MKYITKYYLYNGGLAQVPHNKHDSSIRLILSGAEELSWADYMARAKRRTIVLKRTYDSGYLYLHRKYWDKSYPHKTA